MSITVKPTHPDFVTEISGIDLARPLSPPTATPSRTRSTAMRSWSFTARR